MIAPEISLCYYIAEIGDIKGFIKQLTACEKNSFERKMKIKLILEFYKKIELYKEMEARVTA